MTKRLNWSARQSPGDFEQSAPEQVHYDFDYRRNCTPGAQSWPEKFGPSVIKKAWKAGLVVVAEIEGYPHPVAIQEARWEGQTLTVRVLEGWKVVEHIWTRPDARNLTSSGLLIE